MNSAASSILFAWSINRWGVPLNRKAPFATTSFKNWREGILSGVGLLRDYSTRVVMATLLLQCTCRLFLFGGVLLVRKYPSHLGMQFKASSLYNLCTLIPICHSEPYTIGLAVVDVKMEEKKREKKST